MALPPQLADLESRLARRLDEALDDYRRAVEQRLREAGERLAAAARDLPVPEPTSLLGELQLAAVELGSRRELAREAAAVTLDALRDLDRARTQAEALDALLDRASAAADRVALLLVRDGELVGWGERGFGAAGLAGRSLPARAAERLLAARGCLRLEADEAAGLLGESGAGAGGAAAVVPLVLRDRIAAMLWADRREGEPELAALQILVVAAAQRLELQALSDRAWTPTLYEETEAVGEPLPLWTTEAAPELAPEPGVETPAASEPAIEAAPKEPAIAAAPEPPEPLAAASAAGAEEAAVEELFEAEPATPAPADEPVAESLPEFEFASEPEESARTAAFETGPPTAEPPAAADLLGTVRLPLPPLPEPPAATVEERTAPFEVRAPESPVGAGTHEIPLATASFVAPPAEPDLTEDATMLTGRAAPSEPPPPLAPGGLDEDAPDRTASRGRTTQVAPPPDVQGPGLAFMAGRTARALSDSPVHEEAKRLARLLISEIKLYNEEQVLEGRRNRDLYHRLREDIDRSRQIFEERVDAAVRSETDYFQQELVRSLAGGDPRALGI